MGLNGLPEPVRLFLFEHIDSVEQLDVLLFVRAHRQLPYDSHQISSELRSNPQSVLKRLLMLESGGLVVRRDSPTAADSETLRFQYEPRNVDTESTITALAEIYKQKPQRIFEVIFSPLKISRQFAAAFLVKPKKETDNG